MDERTYAETRRSVHGLAELVLAGPRYRATRQLRLRVLADGIGTWDQPGPVFSAGELVTEEHRVAVDGLTFAEAAGRLGLAASALDDVYHDGPGVDPAETIRLDPDALRVLERAFAIGEEALSAFRPDAERVLWPEHFDVAVAVDDVTYGVSPGDHFLEVPYVYVSPFDKAGLDDPFFNQPFGAATPLSDVGGPEEVAAYFERGRTLLSGRS